MWLKSSVGVRALLFVSNIGTFTPTVLLTVAPSRNQASTLIFYMMIIPDHPWIVSEIESDEIPAPFESPAPGGGGPCPIRVLPRRGLVRSTSRQLCGQGPSLIGPRAFVGLPGVLVLGKKSRSFFWVKKNSTPIFGVDPGTSGIELRGSRFGRTAAGDCCGLATTWATVRYESNERSWSQQRGHLPPPKVCRGSPVVVARQKNRARTSPIYKI